MKASLIPDQCKAGRNTFMALLKCHHKWLSWLDSDTDFVRVFTFDFSKAFDSVPHHIVCNKLQLITINSYVTNWIINFLSSRQQRVVVNDVTQFLHISKGVQQGTVLGPALFSIMANDISRVDNRKSMLIKYAYGITLSAPVLESTGDPSTMEVESLQRRSIDNRMKLNLSTTWEMVLKRTTRKSLSSKVVWGGSESGPLIGPNFMQIHV